MNMASNGVFNAVAVAQDSLPFVTTVFATNVTVTTADLLGEVASTGAAPARVFVHWNLVNGGQDKVLWTNALDLGWRPAGAVTQAVGSLLEDRVYYYRFRATNAYGERWAPAARTFKTVGDPTADNAGGATDIWVGRARLKGRLVEERSQVAIYWGPTDGGTVKSGWAHTNALGWQSSGATVAVDAVELTYGQRYYYRTYATNLAGEDWADTAASFVTLAPTNLALGVTAGLALRLDGAAASSITTNAAGTVTQWADSSGNGRHAGAYGGEPRQIPGGLNGRGVVRFDGVNDALWTTYNFDALAAHTIFTVARYRGTDRERVVSSASRDWAFGFSNGADERWYAGGWVRQAGSGNTAWHVHAGTITAESDPKAAFWKEGALLTNNATGSDNANFRPGALALGGYKYGNRQYSDSEVAEVLLYNRVLADYELDRVGSYLGRKWGVAANYSPYMGATRFGVTNTLAANVTHNGAQLRGRLYGESAVFTVYVYWGGANGGEDPGAWTHSARVGVCANAADVALARDVGQLVAGVTNYYTYRGSNAAGSVWAAAKGFFVPMLPRELRVVSAHGTAVPAVGVHSIAYGASVGCRVSAVDTQGTTQYVCTGWTMTGGQAPASGVTTNFTMTHTNHAVLTWQWGAKYWLDLTAGPHGSVNPPDQWVASGGTVQVRATPVPLYKLSEWTGDIGAIAGGGIYSTNITVTVNAPVSLTANFTESRAGALFLIR
jgi:hypothetical protein